VVAELALLVVELNEPSWSSSSWKRTDCERLKKAAEAAAEEEAAATARGVVSLG
jgi:hypothetical protein